MYLIETYIHDMHNAYRVHIYTPNAYVCISMYGMYLYVSVCIFIDPCRYIHTDTYRYIQYRHIYAIMGYIQMHTDTYRYTHRSTMYTDTHNTYNTYRIHT